MRIHFVGIGGIGISALAQFCHLRGDKVSGSDISETEIFPSLRILNIPIFIPQKEENITPDIDLLVYSEAIHSANPERSAAGKYKITQKSYFEFLGEISRTFKTIAVAGSHGKTTITGMLASGFQTARFDASIFIGSTLREFNGSNFHRGTNEWMLVEACEYRRNFRFLRPEVVVLTQVEWDHPDSYPTKESYFEAFREFCAGAKYVIFHADDEGAQKVLKNFSGVKIPVQSSHSLKFQLGVFGEHNKRNGLLALEAAKLLKLDVRKFQEGLSKFTGAGRRQELLGEVGGVKIYDDYGHHPTEIKAVITAFRAKFPQSRIGLIYEPHQFVRTRQFFDEFITSLSLADQVALFPIYEARDTDEDKAAISINHIIQKIPHSRKIEHSDEVYEFLESLHRGDVLIFMGAGKISGFAKKFLEKL